MIYPRMVAVLMLATGLSACANTPIQTECEFSAAADFGRYTTYALRVDSAPRVQGASSRIQATAQKAIQRSLNDKGYRHVEPDEADLIVSFSITATQEIESASLLPTAVDSLGEPILMARSYERGSLIIDLFDARSGARIWHGWASKILQRSDKDYPEPVINKAVRTTLAPVPEADRT